MNTIALRLVPMLASAHLIAGMSGTAGPAPGTASAALDTASTVLGTAGGVTAIIALVLIIAFGAVVASAMRGLTALLSELLQMAARVTSLLFTAVIVIVLAAVVLVHR